MRQFKIKSVRDHGVQFRANNHQMVGQDGAYSIPVAGKLLWYFGDTLIGSRREGESVWYPGGKPVGRYDMSGNAGIRRMINNCGFLMSPASASNPLGEGEYILDAEGEIKTLIPLDDGEDPDWVRVWCMHGINLHGTVYLFFIKVKMLEEGPFPVNFEITGSGMAKGLPDSWEFSRLQSTNGSDIFWSHDVPQFGSAALVDKKEEFLYLFGVRRGEGGSQNTSLCRVKVDKVETREAYEFFSGSGTWTNNVRQAAVLFTGPPNELSVSYNEYLECYLAVHSQDISGNVAARTAPELWGPWSNPVVITRIVPERKRPLPYPPLVYAAKEHPFLSRESGRILYVTYIEFEEYYPHLLEVELL